VAAPLDKFTERERRVLTFAQGEAQHRNHNYIGTEHLLLGLAREGEGLGAQVLGNLGVDLQKLYSHVDEIVGQEGTPPELGALGLTPRSKKVIEMAVDEAKRMGHPYIGTEHLLLGLIREGEGIAAGVLKSLQVSPESLRAEVQRLLAQAAPLRQRPSRAPFAEPLTSAGSILRRLTHLSEEEREAFRRLTGVTDAELVAFLGELAGLDLGRKRLKELAASLERLRPSLERLASLELGETEPAVALPPLGED